MKCVKSVSRALHLFIYGNLLAALKRICINCKQMKIMLKFRLKYGIIDENIKIKFSYKNAALRFSLITSVIADCVRKEE